MNEMEFEILSAEVYGVGPFVEPDYSIRFTANSGEKSIDALAHEIGGRLWRKMHGETPSQIHYKVKWK